MDQCLPRPIIRDIECLGIGYIEPIVATPFDEEAFHGSACGIGTKDKGTRIPALRGELAVIYPWQSGFSLASEIFPVTRTARI